MVFGRKKEINFRSKIIKSKYVTVRCRTGDLNFRANFLVTGVVREVLLEKVLLRYMKIHIFALRWRDEIKRSSQLRTLLKRAVEKKETKNYQPVERL